MIKSRSGERPVLMCVDDDEQLLETLEYLLGKHFPSYHIVACFNGQDALEQLQLLYDSARDLHLILSDQVMPDLTGIELLERTPTFYPDAIRIILSGQAALSSAIDGIKLGIDDYLEKPLSEMELVKTIRNHLNNYLLRQENRRLQELLRRSRQRTSQIMELAFRNFNSHLTQLLSNTGSGESVLQSIRHSRDNIRQLSLLYRVDQNLNLGDGITSLDPGSFIMDAIRGLADPYGRPLLAKKQHEVGLVNYEENEVIYTHRASLRIIVDRLVESACRFGPEKSDITITLRGPRFLRTQERPDAKLSPEIEEMLRRSCLAISVRNEGVPTEGDCEQFDLLRAWQPASRAETSLRGLGMVIVQEYLLLLGGQLFFEANSGVAGTTVHAVFPTDIRRHKDPTRESNPPAQLRP